MPIREHRTILEARCHELTSQKERLVEREDSVKVKLRELQRVCRHDSKVETMTVAYDTREYKQFCEACGWTHVSIQERSF